jgi:hypothetical protein
LAVVLAWILSNIPGKQDQTYAEKRCAEQHLRYSEVESVIGVQGEKPSSSDQTASQNEYEQNGEPNWCDLAAQQSMANSTRWAVYAAWVSALVTIAGVILVAMTLHYTANALDEAKTATKVAQIGAEEAIKTNEITRQQLIASQRPWIKVTMQMADGMSFEDGALKTSVLFKMQNIGNYPAKNIWLDAAINIHKFGSGERPEIYLSRLIEDSKIKRPMPMGRFLFPNDEYSIRFIYTVSSEEMSAAKERMNFIFPVIVGCVRYDFDNSPIGHHSAFVREIFRKDTPRPITREQNRAPDVIFPDEGKIELADLVIRDSFNSANYAN